MENQNEALLKVLAELDITFEEREALRKFMCDKEYAADIVHRLASGEENIPPIFEKYAAETIAQIRKSSKKLRNFGYFKTKITNP